MQHVTGAVEVRPVDSRDERRALWYRERLADPSLVAAGVVVTVNGNEYLAVPVGGRRRGGCLPIGFAEAVQPLRRALAGREGFPAVRVCWSTRPSVCHVVEWGEPAPDTDDDAVCGRFYGYSERAIASFVARG